MVTPEDMAVLRRVTELAQAGGWDSVGGVDRLKAYSFLIDPEFWKGLGKSLGWKKGEWIQRQHAFIDHLAEDGNVVSYFQEVLIPIKKTKKK